MSRPETGFFMHAYDLAIHNYFDNFISLCVAINTLALCIEYEGSPLWF